MTIFLHIPKTAGSTFNKILERQAEKGLYRGFYGKGNLISEDQIRNMSDYNLASHWFRFDMLKKFESINVITFLREPISKVISAYQAVKRYPNHSRHDYFVNNKITLEDFVSDPRFDAITCNLQSRYLISDSSKDLSKLTHQEIYHDVIGNLLKPNVFFGLTEQFDLSVLYFHHKLNWNRLPVYKSQNVSRSSTQISDEVYEMIAKKNSIDLKLYKWAKEEFKSKVLEMENWEARLEAFKEANHRFNNSPKARIKNTLLKVKPIRQLALRLKRK